MKNFAKLFLKRLLQVALYWIPLKRNVIIFESYPNLDGSPWMIYNELKKRGFGNKYKFVWAVDSSYKNLSLNNIEKIRNALLYFSKKKRGAP